MSDGTKIEVQVVELGRAKRVMPSVELIEQLSEVDCAYIAGLIDGEGTIYVMKHREKTFYPAISVCMTHGGVLGWLGERLGLARANVPRTPAGWRDQFSIRIHGVRAVALCRRLLPHLKVKHGQAAMLIDFPCDERPNGGRGVRLRAEINERRREIRDLVNDLNVRGKQ